MLTRALSNHKQRLHFAEWALQQSLQLLMSSMESSGGRGSISLSRSEASSQVRVLQDALKRLSATSEPAATPPVALAYTPNTSFLRSDTRPTIADISNASLKHLNLVHVTKLEHQLCSLYGQLNAFSLQQQPPVQRPSTNAAIASNKLMESLQKACEDLQQLSFLVPTVPWSKRCCLPEVAVDNLMKAFPKLTSAKHQDVKDILASVLKLSEHRYKLLQCKCDSLQLELTHLMESEATGSAHVKSTSNGLISELCEYHESIKDTLVIPVKGVLDKFNVLSDSPTDENLKVFLEEFKRQSTDLLQVCATIDSHEITNDIAKAAEQGYDRKLRKTLKRLKSTTNGLEDRENELLQEERETRGELNHRLSQLSTNPVKVKVKPFTIGNASSSKVGHNKELSADSPAAVTFMSKIEKLETLQTAQSDYAPFSQDSVVQSEQSVARRPSWLQEMKDDLSSKQPTKKTNSSSRRSFNK